MEIQYYGGNCIKIASKKASIVVDDNLETLGQKSIVGPKDIALYTNVKLEPQKSVNAHFVVDSPGEYEVSDASIHGIAAQAHMDQEKTALSTIYRVILDDVRIAVVGHIYPELSDDQLEALGTIDILFVPIGGNGYTLDGIGAQKIIKKIEPKIIIPSHYDEPGLKYEVPQTDLETALRAVAMEPAETLDSLKFKQLELTDATKLIVLTRQ